MISRFSLAVLISPLLFATTGARAETVRLELELLAPQFRLLCARRVLHGDLQCARAVHGALSAEIEGWGRDEKKAETHNRLVTEVMAIPASRSDLIPLLQHESPRVRALAILKLVALEDVRVLPAIARLMPDEPRSRYPSDALTDDQMPGHVAESAVRMYLSKAGVHHLTRKAFDAYWETHADCDRCASLFAVRLARASLATLPPPEERHGHIRKVREEIDELPEEDRAWLLLFLRDRSDFEGADILASDEERLAAARRIPRDHVRRFLRREPPTSDPDLLSRFATIASFILMHATDLLEEADAALLLERDRFEASLTGGDSSPLWAIAASRLQRRDVQTLRAALERFEKDYEAESHLSLAHELWRATRGTDRTVIDGFFEDPKRSAIGATSMNIELLDAAADEGDRRLVAALVLDARFAEQPWYVLRKVIEIAPRLGVTIATEEEWSWAWRRMGGPPYHWKVEDTKASYPEYGREIEEAIAKWRARLNSTAKAWQDPESR